MFKVFLILWNTFQLMFLFHIYFIFSHIFQYIFILFYFFVYLDYRQEIKNTELTSHEPHYHNY